MKTLVKVLSTAEAGGEEDGKRDQEEVSTFTLIPSKIHLSTFSSLSTTVNLPVDWLSMEMIPSIISIFCFQFLGISFLKVLIR